MKKSPLESETRKSIDIVAGVRHRRDMGDLDALAESIRTVGLLQPVGITPENLLVFGERRLRAMRKLGWTDIPVRVVNVARIVDGEYAENEIRKDFTVTERLDIAKTVEAEIGNRSGQRTDREPVATFPQVPAGTKTREVAAKRAGFGSEGTMRNAKLAIECGVPELVDAMDANVVTISAAAKVAELPPEEQREIVAKGPRAVAAAAEQLRGPERKGVRATKIGDMIKEIAALANRPHHSYPYLQIKQKVAELLEAYSKAFGIE